MAQKATTSFAGRQYIAWFTPEIPVPDGPYKFNGLPGLIIEIADLKDHYHFKLTGFEILKEPVKTILDLDNFKLVTKKDFIKAKNNFDRDPLTAAAFPGSISIRGAKRQRERLSRRYNLLKAKHCSFLSNT